MRRTRVRYGWLVVVRDAGASGGTACALPLRYLSNQAPIYAAAFAGQLMFYGLALHGAVLHRREHVPAPRPSAFGV